MFAQNFFDRRWKLVKPYWVKDTDLCPCGEAETMSHIVESWQNWMGAYLGYTLQMNSLFHGWPVMVMTRIREEEEWYVYLQQ